MRYFKKHSQFRDDVLFMARVSEHDTLVVGDDEVDITDEPNDSYGSVAYLINNDYIETSESEFNNFLKQTRIWQTIVGIV